MFHSSSDVSFLFYLFYTHFFGFLYVHLALFFQNASLLVHDGKFLFGFRDSIDAAEANERRRRIIYEYMYKVSCGESE